MDEIEKLQKIFDKVVDEQNKTGLADFEGYSPFDMNFILYDTFSEKSPIQLLKLSQTDYSKIPILNQTKYLLDIIDKAYELKLTNKEYLPTKVVYDIYDKGFIKDEAVEAKIVKLRKETDVMSINLTRVLLELSGIVKKRNKKLSLTKKGKVISNNDYELLKTIFITFAAKFNWAYYDGYGDNQIGQIGFGFTLILLSKYGLDKKPASFYADKYFKAFPMLIEQIEPSYTRTSKEMAFSCYSIRTFDRFLDYFGLIRIEAKDRWDMNKFITKTALFDKLIKVEPPNNAA